MYVGQQGILSCVLYMGGARCKCQSRQTAVLTVGVLQIGKVSFLPHCFILIRIIAEFDSVQPTDQ